MHYEIYIDVVFFTNLLIDYILIRFTGILFRCGRSRKRALLGAAAGAVFSCWITVFCRISVWRVLGSDRQ